MKCPNCGASAGVGRSDCESCGSALPADAAGTSGSASAEFSQMAESASPGIVREFWEFLRDNKKWWITPIVIVLLLVGLLVFLSGTGAAPFIYTLF